MSLYCVGPINFLFLLEKRSPHVPWADVKLAILLPQPPNTGIVVLHHHAQIPINFPTKMQYEREKETVKDRQAVRLTGHIPEVASPVF